MSSVKENWRRLELGGGSISEISAGFRFVLPPIEGHYADAQIDDYGGLGRYRYVRRPGTVLSLRALFSHGADTLTGTAGFGFWNAPFGDPTTRWPALPQAAWFFFASPPTDLPLAPQGAGRGWFAGTLDASTGRALAWAPLAPLIILLCQSHRLRQRVWPIVQKSLGISFVPLPLDMTTWHDYRLSWQRSGCYFWVDGRPVLQTHHSPRGPMGFVCWLDNQFMIATPSGRLRWGILDTVREQWLEVTDLRVN
jgi:hypothetical protein